MPVPREWWETALRTGTPARSEYVELLFRLRGELLKVGSLAPQVGIPELVALAFIDDSTDNNPRFGRAGGERTPEEYLAAAREVLANDPAVARFGASLAQVIDHD
jgi:hypothetical protein